MILMITNGSHAMPRNKRPAQSARSCVLDTERYHMHTTGIIQYRLWRRVGQESNKVLFITHTNTHTRYQYRNAPG